MSSLPSAHWNPLVGFDFASTTIAHGIAESERKALNDGGKQLAGERAFDGII